MLRPRGLKPEVRTTFAVALVLGQSLQAAPKLPARHRGERFQKILYPLADDYPGIHADISASSPATS